MSAVDGLRLLKIRSACSDDIARPGSIAELDAKWWRIARGAMSRKRRCEKYCFFSDYVICFLNYRFVFVDIYIRYDTCVLLLLLLLLLLMGMFVYRRLVYIGDVDLT